MRPVILTLALLGLAACTSRPLTPSEQAFTATVQDINGAKAATPMTVSVTNIFPEGPPNTIGSADRNTIVGGAENNYMLGFGDDDTLSAGANFDLVLPTCASGYTLVGAGCRNTGAAVLMAFGGGIALFFLRNLAQVLGDNGQITPEMAAWTPPAVGAALAVALILKREDG